MAGIVITISTDNAAFEDDGELPRILRSLALRMGNDAWPPARSAVITITDANGNRVGEARFIQDEAE